MPNSDQSKSVPAGTPIPTADSGELSLRRLRAGPQTAVDLTELPDVVRDDIAVIGDQRSTPSQAQTATDAFTPVYYLPADEAAAIDLFVKLNAHRIATLDPDQNQLKQRLSVAMYIRILAAAGRLSIRHYDHVVLERREDGVVWLIAPEWYDTHPAERYTPGSHVARVPPTVDLQQVYYSSGDVVSKTDLRATAIEGNVGLVLCYYRDADAYRCRPAVISDNVPVLQKDDRQTNSTTE